MFTARSRRSVLTLFTAVLLLTGCAYPSMPKLHRATLTLHQPFAPAAQQKLTLQSDHACCSTEGDEQLATLSFALPGAVDGPRAFVIYLSAPIGTRPHQVVPQERSSARGFIIQEVGKLAGRSDFADGTVRISDAFFRPRARHLELDVRTADGARLVGSATLEFDARQVAAIRREFAADIATLLPPAPESDEPPGPQGSADAGAPRVVSDDPSAAGGTGPRP